MPSHRLYHNNQFVVVRSLCFNCYKPEGLHVLLGTDLLWYSQVPRPRAMDPH